MVVIVKHLRRLVFVNGTCLLAGRGRVGTVNHGSTQRSNVHFLITNFKNDAIFHSIKDILGLGLRVIFGQDYVMKTMVAISGKVIGRGAIGYYSAASLCTVDVLSMS